MNTNNNVTNVASPVTTTTSASKSVRKVGRPRVANSAMSRARTILENTPATVPRKDVVKQFVALGLSKTLASSYYTILNKRVTRI